MNFNQFVEYNWLNLSNNYNSRSITDSFHRFCLVIFIGMKKNVWLPNEYTNNIDL